MLTGDMGGGSGMEAPRLLKRSISAGRSGMETSQNHLRDVSVNLVATPGNENFPIAQHLFSPQIHLQLSSNHVNLLSTNILTANPRPLHAIPAGGTQEGTVLPINSLDAGKGIFGNHSGISNETVGLRTHRCLKRPSQVDPYMSILNSTGTEAASNIPKTFCPVENDVLMKDLIVPMIGYSVANTKGQSTNMSKNGEFDILAQSGPCVTPFNKASYDTAKSHENLTILSREARAQAAMNNRLRRAKIAEGIKALQNSAPCSNKSNKEAALDDVIDYIKFLKLQLKVLSQSRLSGEATPYPFIHLEGYGHYLLHEQTCSEPLEEMMGQLMELNPQAATELLESKGLILMPTASAYTLLQTT